jgi:DNA-binding response OmpR family regulator
VLIVEDDRTARRAIGQILKRLGFAVSEAATLGEAMHGVAQDPPPQWIVLDLMLPDGCGIDVIRKVRSERLASRICIVTGCGSELLNDARRAGAEHTFVKPLDVERLMTVMTAA